MPVVWASTSSMVCRFWSSIFWRVTTVTDWGISLSVCSPLPTVTMRLAYDPEPSVIALRSACAVTRTSLSRLL
ncbi:hypothetical protein FQZ97_660690 [compost metagenome]